MIMASNTSTTTTTTTTTPPPPPTATTTTTTTTVAKSPLPLRPTSQPRPQFHHNPFHPHPQPPPQHHQIQPTHFQAQAQAQTQLHPHDPIRYPLASSGRGLLPTSRSPPIHHPRPHPHPHPHPQFSEQQLHNSAVHFQHHQQPQQQHSNHNHHVVRGTFLHPSSTTTTTTHLSPASIPGVPPVRGVLPQSKVGPFLYSASESNAPEDPIDKGTDDTVVTLRDRKVRISDGASLYALCRSWLRDGYLEETQPQYGDALKSLSKPLPLPLPPHESSPPKRKERDDETEADEVENLAEADAKELLSSHVKRAKKIRARLREERLQRIERYKSRLVLLLPHSVPE